MTHVFISYARRDGAAYADRLQIGLEAKGYRTWRDTRDIDPDKDFTATVEDAIERASYVVVCITPDVKRKPTAEEYASFVRLEIGYARAVKKPMYVVTFDPKIVAPIYLINHSYVYFDPHNDTAWSSAFGRLCTLLDKPVSQFVQPNLDTAADDPFRPYVEKLLTTASDYLWRNILRIDEQESHIELQVMDTPEAVPEQPPQMLDLVMMDEQTGVAFRTFPEAFAHFGGRGLLLGEPGAGKTITLMATARQAASERLADPTAPLPLYGLLAMWDSLKQTPLAEWLGNSDKLLTSDQVRAVMDAGKALLLLDGLDEMGSDRIEKQISEVTKETEEKEVHYDPRKRFLSVLKAQLGQNHALVTCRITDYEAIGDLAALDGAVTLQKLTDTQLREYLKDLPKLLEAVETDESLREISRTPLLLSFFAFAFRDRGDDLTALEDLREGALRDAIFNAYMEKRYSHEERRLERFGEKPPFTLEEIREVLGRVAMENAGGMRRSQYSSWLHVDNVLYSSDFNQSDTFCEFCLRLQYLHQGKSRSLGFVHLLLRDTLIYNFCLANLRDTSLYMSDSDPNPALALGVINDRRSTEHLLQLAEDQVADLLLRICAIHGLERSVAILTSNIVERIIRIQADSQHNISRVVTYMLGKAGKVALRPLISALRDANVLIRQRAAIALGYLGDASAVDAIIYALDDTEMVVRAHAASALGSLRATQSVDRLIQLLADSNIYVRSRAAFSLKELGNVAVDSLISALTNPNTYVRLESVKLLGEIGDVRAIDAIINALVDRNPFVCSRAVDALGSLGDHRAIKPLVALVANVQYSSLKTVHQSVSHALEQIGTPEALAALAEWRGRGGDKP
jgi:hypothetical protein